MSLKTTLIVGGLAAALGTGAAFAQSYSDNPPPSQDAPYGHHHRHGERVPEGRLARLPRRRKAVKFRSRPTMIRIGIAEKGDEKARVNDDACGHGGLP